MFPCQRSIIQKLPIQTTNNIPENDWISVRSIHILFSSLRNILASNSCFSTTSFSNTLFSESLHCGYWNSGQALHFARLTMPSATDFSLQIMVRKSCNNNVGSHRKCFEMVTFFISTLKCLNASLNASITLSVSNILPKFLTLGLNTGCFLMTE